MRLAWAVLLAGGLTPFAPAAPATRDTAAAQEPLRVAHERGSGAVLLGPVLADSSLHAALRSGLPLRLRFRVELWREGFFDDLVGTETWTTLLAFDPLESRYLVHTGGPGRPSPATPFPTFASARAAAERPHAVGLRPDRPGRYYFTAELDIETLSLSDFEELEKWLRGELSPAVRGEESVGSALGSGLKRLLIRALRLPARRYDARSESFRYP